MPTQMAIKVRMQSIHILAKLQEGCIWWPSSITSYHKSHECFLSFCISGNGDCGTVFLVSNEVTCIGCRNSKVYQFQHYVCCGQSPVAPVVEKEHVQKKFTLIGIVSDRNPSMLKSVKNGEQQIKFLERQSLSLEVSYQYYSFTSFYRRVVGNRL